MASSSDPDIELAPEQWAALDSLMSRILEMPESERAAFISSQALSAAELAALSQWLSALTDSQDFLSARNVPTLSAGEIIGAWRVIGLIGQGGSGEVYRVERADGAFELQAALKLLARSDDSEDVRRFSIERQLLARLEHPDIARLLDGGTHVGRPYAVLELVNGERFDKVAMQLPLAKRLALFRRVVSAVAYAHRHLIVHRDLKPANVLVTRDGSPKLLDFGIAKPIDNARSEVTLALRFTPDYCAPEQLKGEPITPATDVFALGVMLYELLTGVRCWPLGGNSIQRALDRLNSDVPPPPSGRLPKADRRMVSGALDAIVMKALQPQPSDRYGNAEALLDDLERAADGRPIAARGETSRQLVGRLFRRHRIAVTAAGTFVIALLIGAAALAWQIRQTSIERDLARQEALRSAAVKDYLLTLFRIAGESQGQDTLTPRLLLSKGAERLEKSLGQNAEASADSLLALAELYFRLNDYTGAAPLFERILGRAPHLDEAVATQARFNLAQCYLRMSRYAEARTMLDDAQQYWGRDTTRWRNLLLESRSTQAQLERAEGDIERSISTLERALEMRLQISGEVHTESATLMNDLAVAYFQSNRFAQARSLFERAMSAWRVLQAEESVDALNTLNNWAALETRENNLDQAERLFSQALATRRALFGPSAALAALLNNVGKLQLRLDRPEKAIAPLQEAAQLAVQYAGENSLLSLSALCGLGEAQAAAGAMADARSTLDVAEQRIATHFSPPHPLSGIVQVAQARRFLKAGDRPAAVTRLRRAQALLEQAGPAGAAHLAQANALLESLH